MEAEGTASSIVRGAGQRSDLDLGNLRRKIDRIDSNLVSLLNERASLSVNIGLLKDASRKRSASSDPHVENGEYVTKRHAGGDLLENEDALFQIPAEKIKAMNVQGPLTNDAIQAIFREILSASISLQKPTTVAYLGPPGTFTHQAAFNRFGDSVTYSPQATISDVFSAIEAGHTTYAVVPFENSTFGSVQQTLDRFISSPVSALVDSSKSQTTTSIGSLERQRTVVQIGAEQYLHIHHCLLSNAPSLRSIQRVYSHPEAFGQCHRWLEANLRGVERITVASTSAAAKMAAQESESAAICSMVCADLYGLNIIAHNIEDLKTNTTRFFILSQAVDGPVHPQPSPDTEYRTLIYLTVDHRQPGSLCDALSVIKNQNINLTKIDSRPSGQRPWHYIFFLEMEGHMDDANVKRAFQELQTYCLDIRVLGTYPNQRPR
ncbi:Prephenate dehydratase-domain-containing protein [Cladochytrium replicatum]|nr:Prephenate dehydratase-domain-containing protein [Cladochytrium replicatum]